MKGKTKGDQRSVEEEFKPSAPIPTGTIPRHGNKPSRVQLEEINNSYTLEVCEDECSPSAPPVDLVDQVVGYEKISFAAVSIPPPSQLFTVANEPSDQSRPSVPVQPQLTEKQARAALFEYASNHCCYGKDTAKNMAITQIQYSAAFHYELQTFTEKRETSWAFTPFKGGEVDDPSQGTAPLPWEIPAHPNSLFHNEFKVIQVPHTCVVKQCHDCKGLGSLSCKECSDKGWIRCIHCQGEGWATDAYGYQERCFHCHCSAHGYGRQDCLKCNAKGRIPCQPCDSYGQIKYYIQLTITWKANNCEHIVERTSLPEELVRGVSGQIVFVEENMLVTPISHFPDETINMASTQLVHHHSKAFSDQKILAQRQQVRVIPVTEIRYVWKRHPEGQFYVYGYENKVHAPDYPQTCCWGCSIM